MKVIDNMRKTIKKKKAFTLVELMGVLVIIGVLTAILIPVISNALKENKEKVYEQQLDSMKLAAKNLVTDNTWILPTEQNEIVNINLGQLKLLGYVDNNIVNPITKKEISNCTIITVKKKQETYEYNIDVATLEMENCDKSSSSVNISSPSTKYITSTNNTTSYIIIVGNDTDELFSKYVIDNSKIELVGSAAETSKYFVDGENGIYKLTLIGGATEGNLSFKLNSGAIIDESQKDLIGNSSLLSESVIVDYIAPTITIDNPNYGDNWKNESDTADYVLNLSSIENGSGIDYWSYSYDKTTWVDYSESYEQTEYTTPPFSVNRNQLVYIKVCDKAGNCNDTGESMIKIDTQKPVLTYELRKENATGSLLNNDTWVNVNVHRKLFPTDGLSGVENVEYYNAGSWHTEGNVDSATFYEGINNTNYRVTDNAGNISDEINIIIKVDKTAPTIEWAGYGTPIENHNKHSQFIFRDNSGYIVLYRAHCAMTNNSSDNNSCAWSNAVYRLQSYYTYNTSLTLNGVTDNKAIKEGPLTSGSIHGLSTQMGDGVNIQFAFIACDEAGNCTSSTVGSGCDPSQGNDGISSMYCHIS